MKKVILFLVAILIASTAFGQWTTKFHPADELRGTSSWTENIYTTEDGYVFSCHGEEHFSVYTPKGFFYEYSKMHSPVTIGFYKDGKLVEKMESNLFVGDGYQEKAYSNDAIAEGLAKKVIHHVKYVGDVRLIPVQKKRKIEDDHPGSIDIKLPMNKDLVL